MTNRVYFVPLVGTGSILDAWRPKYIAALGVTATVMAYGHLPQALVLADVTPTQHASLVANPDLLAVPADLGGTMGAGAVTQVQAALEAALVPAQWVAIGQTWASLVRRVALIFQFVQRYVGLYGDSPIHAATDLDLTISQLPTLIRDQLSATATSLGYDVSGITGGMTVRVALVALADQWGATPVVLGAPL